MCVSDSFKFDTAVLFNVPIQGDGNAPFDLSPGDDQDPLPTTQTTDLLIAKYALQQGQIWRLGRHLIIYGDPLQDVTLDNLLRAGGHERSFKPGQGVFAGVYTHLPNAKTIPDYPRFFSRFQSLSREMLRNDASLFFTIIGHSEHGYRDPYIERLVVDMADKWGWARIDNFCWIRRSISGEFINRFKDAYQIIYHFARSPRIAFNPANVMQTYKQARDAIPYHKQRRGISKPHISSFSTRALPDNVLEYYGSSGNWPPHELCQFFMRAYSDVNDMWLDPYIGNGHALIAAEKCERVLYGADNNAGQVAMAIENWANLTDSVPELVML